MLIDNSFASKSPNMLLKSPLILTNGLEKTTINTEGPFGFRENSCTGGSRLMLLLGPGKNSH